MIDKQVNTLSSYRIGILGCGHLGSAVATALLANGLPQEQLYLSVRTNPRTRQKLRELGLLRSLVDNEILFRESSIVLLTVKPQDFGNLQIFPTNATIAACIAGMPLALLKQKAPGALICRIMLSGPDTILSGRGVAAVFPPMPEVEQLLRALGLHVFRADTESVIDVFTAGVCMPAALLITREDEIETDVAELSAQYPMLSVLYEWATSVTPSFQTDQEKDAYLARMLTKGGVTAAIVDALHSGVAFAGAIRKGIARSCEIAKELSVCSQ